jgi:hypothetical protein
MKAIPPRPENLAPLARALNQAVARNRQQFPEDFMFQLSMEKYEAIWSRFATAFKGSDQNSSQTVTSSRKHRGLSYRTYAFVEQDIAMLSSALRSPGAVEVNIAIMCTFVQLRRFIDSNRELARKIKAIEKRYDEQLAVVFDAIKRLIADDQAVKVRPKRSIGFIS